jgi:hypothetical protein
MSESEEHYDLNNPEDKAKLKKKLGQDINVTIDDVAQRELNEKIIERLDKVEGKDVHTSDDLSERKIKFFNDYKDQRILDATTNEELRDVMKSIVQLGLERAKGTPAGSAPLEGNYPQQKSDLYRMKFTDAKTMIDTVGRIARENAGTPEGAEAQSYLDALTAKWLQSKKAHLNVPDVGYFDANSPENQPLMKKVQTFLTPQDPSEGELGKVIENWRQSDPRVRHARRRMDEGESPSKRDN